MIFYPSALYHALDFMNKELPKDIGGYQHVCHGPTEDGDIWVQDGKPKLFLETSSYPDVEAANNYWRNERYSVYRKIPQPGHHQPEVVEKLKEAGLKPSGCLANTDQMQVAGLGEYYQRATTKETKPSNPKDLIGSDKVPLHLWPATASVMGAMALLDGMLKYGRSNFRVVGVRATIYYDALNRHMNAWMEGEDQDPDSGLPHLSHALACLAVIVDAQAAGKLEDDRLVKGDYRKLIDELTPHVKRLKEKHKDKSPQHYTVKDNKPLAGHELCG